MAEIPINAAVPRNQWTATAAQTVFAYEWPIFDEADIVVTQTDFITGVISPLAITADYTVQNVGAEDGGTITLVSGALVDDIITLYRDVIIKRLADFEAAGDFRSATLNREMDIFTMIMQEAARDWARAILLDPSDPTAGLVLPLPADRAGKFIGFTNDASADLIAAAGVTTSIVSAFMETVLDDVSAAAARATLGATTVGDAVFIAASAAAARTALALGDAALKTVGVADGNVPAMNATGYPAANGSLITALAAAALVAGSDARGDILYRGASNYQRLAKGTAGQFLKIGANDPEWAAVETSLETEQATTSGTEKDFTGIASDAKEITVMFAGVSTNGISGVEVQLGDSGGFETSGYAGSIDDRTNVENLSSGFLIYPAASWGAGTIVHGSIVLTLENSANNTWMVAVNIGVSNIARAVFGGGSKSLSAVLTQIRIKSVNGTDTFDLGAVNISIKR